MDMAPMMVFILTFVSIVAIGIAALVYRATRRRQIEARLAQVEDQLLGGDKHVSFGLRMLAGIGSAVSMGPTSENLRKKVSHAGFHARWAPHVFLGIKILLILAALPIFPALKLSTGLSTPGVLLLGILCLLIAFLLPDLVLNSRLKARRVSIRHHLPDAVDLLEVCVSAGIGLDMAWNMVGDEIRRVCPILADEMTLTNLEIHLGSTQVDAMRHLSERTGVLEISRLVAVLVQSERFGTSIAETLCTFAASMREGRSMRAEEAAEKMSVMMLLPMVFFIFPAVFIVVVGPAAIILVKLLG